MIRTNFRYPFFLGTEVIVRIKITILFLKILEPTLFFEILKRDGGIHNGVVALWMIPVCLASAVQSVLNFCPPLISY
jgi:hypothetical protein